MLNSLDGKRREAADKREAVKLVVAGEARRSWPAGGSLAKWDQGAPWKQAMCSGWDTPMMEVWPGVSISARTSMPR